MRSPKPSLELIGPLLLIGACAHAPTQTSSGPTILSEDQLRRDQAAAPQVKALLEAQQNWAPVLSRDGKKVLFRSDRGGSAELYIADVDRPDVPATKLVSGPDRVVSAVFTRDGRAILFRRDTGADENFHIFRVGLDGTGLVDLTPFEPLWRDSPLLPRDKPNTIVYSGRMTSQPVAVLMMQELTGGMPRIVYRDRFAATALDVSPDGTAALWLREAKAGGHELFEVDLSTGESRLLCPLDGKPARITAAAYAADPRAVLIATDFGTEVHSLIALDVKSLRVLAEYREKSPPSAAIGAIVPSPKGDRVAVMVDAGNRSMVRMLNASTLALERDIDTPLGTVGLGQETEVRFSLGTEIFQDDGARLAIEYSTPHQPSDIYVVEASSGEVKPLRSEKRAALEHLGAITATIANVLAFDGLPIPVNVYLPLERTHKLPAIVELHGGPDASTPVTWSAWTRVFLRFGFAVLEPNVRGSTGFGRAYETADDKEKRADVMKDLEAVNAWARAQSWCDGEHIVIEGGSYGGYLVLMGLTRQPKLWSAGIDLAGPSDLTTWLKPGEMPDRYLTEFGDPRKDAALFAKLSPIRDVGKIVAPLFVYHGQNDGRVPRSEADAIVGALRARNIPVEYMVAKNEGHTVARRDNQVEFLTRVLRFLEDQLSISIER
jgi:dipeptidyl aminopeptidase/acylaminoacyl peptidase